MPRSGTGIEQNSLVRRHRNATEAAAKFTPIMRGRRRRTKIAVTDGGPIGPTCDRLASCRNRCHQPFRDNSHAERNPRRSGSRDGRRRRGSGRRSRDRTRAGEPVFDEAQSVHGKSKSVRCQSVRCQIQEAKGKAESLRRENDESLCAEEVTFERCRHGSAGAVPASRTENEDGFRRY